ncbi:hypothetical protein AB0H69_46755 [Streptomyces phaeochromogenes]|uniref:hypothetical protein n=1 Tax=Streptomyces phaeochromogenes TaxID=1923 RepID=UPI0034043AAC
MKLASDRQTGPASRHSIGKRLAPDRRAASPDVNKASWNEPWPTWSGNLTSVREALFAAVQLLFQSNVIKRYRALLAAVRRDPARHGLDGSYATKTAFILGPPLKA